MVLHNITKLLSDPANKNVCVLSLDMSKAFDVLSHRAIASTIAKLHIDDYLYNWIINYLTNRKQCTSFIGKTSDYKGITSGVVQGSGLGPLIFIMATYDYICYNEQNMLLQYADDCFFIIP